MIGNELTGVSDGLEGAVRAGRQRERRRERTLDLALALNEKLPDVPLVADVPHALEGMPRDLPDFVAGRH